MPAIDYPRRLNKTAVWQWELWQWQRSGRWPDLVVAIGMMMDQWPHYVSEHGPHLAFVPVAADSGTPWLYRAAEIFRHDVAPARAWPPLVA